MAGKPTGSVKRGNMKKCADPQCGLWKLATDFPRSGVGRTHSRCKPCFNKRSREKLASDKGQPAGIGRAAAVTLPEYAAPPPAPAPAKWASVAAFDEHPDDVVDDLPDADTISYGTPMQQVCAEELVRCGSVAVAAAALQLTPNQLRAHLDELQRRAATRGYAPGSDMTKPTPSGFHVKGVSTFYDGDGNVKGQWVKTNKDQDEKYQMLLDAMSTIADRWTGLAEPVAAPTMTDDDLLCVYPMGDPHIGMFSWASETGHNFDLAIAERDLYTAVDHLVDLAPPAKHGLLVNVGDFYHADNRNSTTTGGTPVDSDGRWPKVMSVGVRLMRRMIDRALEKHEHVTIINSNGNHDWHGSIMLAICLAQFYEREPRVTVETAPTKCHYYRFGKVLIGATHGDTIKLAELGGVMACDRAEDWGDTFYRYWLTGHIHHDTVKELKGCIVESFRTLAPSDAWHKGQGYRSGRDMKLLVMHREHGQIMRHVVGINQIHALNGVV